MTTCTGCNAAITEDFAFCPRCGAAFVAEAAAGEAEAQATDGPQEPSQATNWRDVARAAREAAAPFVNRAADEAQRLRNAHQAREQQPAPSSLAKAPQQPLSVAPAPTGQPQLAEAAASPGWSERIGRGVGSTAGFATRSFVGTAAEPIVDKVWRERPDLPTWQKVLGAFGWAALILTPHGWVFLAVSFFVMVIMGHENPYSWAAWVTKWSGVFLAVTLVIGLIVLGVSAGGDSSSGY